MKEQFSVGLLHGFYKLALELSHTEVKPLRCFLEPGLPLCSGILSGSGWVGGCRGLPLQ